MPTSSLIISIVRVPFYALISVALLLLFINYWVYFQGSKKIIRAEPSARLEYVIVLGASVRGEELSGALQSRMNKALEILNEGKAEKILITGDGTDQYYNETLAMAKFLAKNSIPDSLIETDPKGYSTFDSIKRAKVEREVESAYIVSQPFHLARAVWLANALGMNAVGIETSTLTEEWFYSTREIPARIKDFVFFHLNRTPSEERQEPFFAK